MYLDDLTIRPIAEVADVARQRVDLRADDDAPGLVERVLAADVVAFASPVYWQGVTGQMKCFVDRWSAYWGDESFRRRMRGKGFAVICPFADRSSDQSTWVTAPVKKKWNPWNMPSYVKLPRKICKRFKKTVVKKKTP